MAVEQNRHENRDLCADLVKISWENESGSVLTEWAIIHDISSSGASLGIEVQIPHGISVTLEFGMERCRARVKYCYYDRMNYLVGIQFEDGYRWSRRRWKPEHLTQFRLREVKKTS